MGSMAVMALSTIAAAALSMALTPSQSSQGSVDYSALRQIEEEKSADAAAQRAEQAEAKRREELRVQSMYGQDVLTSDSGDDDDLTVKEAVLGDKDDDREGTESSTGVV